MDFWNDLWNEITTMFSDLFSADNFESLGFFVVGLVILVVGWFVARILSKIVYRWLHRIRTDERFAKLVSADSESVPIEKWASMAVFYFLLLIVFIFFFGAIEGNTSGSGPVSGPLNAMLGDLVSFVPNLIGALFILFIAWILATIAKGAIIRVLDMTNIDEQISETAHLSRDAVSKSLAQGVFWLVYLFFLPTILAQFDNMESLVAPIENVVNNIIGGIPNLLLAAITVFLGWVIARIVRQIVTNLLEAAHVDRFGEQIGLTDDQSISGLLGLIAYILILITAITQALIDLDLESISAPLVGLLTTVAESIQNLVGAVVIVAIAYYVGKLLSGFVTNVLSGIGFDTITEKIGFNFKPSEGSRTLSETVGYLVMVTAILLASVEAARMLNIEILAESLQGFLVFGAQAIGALIILAVGVYLANLIRSIILSAGGEHAADFANVARTIILVFVVVIAITQLDIGGVVVTSAFTIVLGAIAVAAALAFGLGARDVAGKQVETWVKNWKKK